MVSLKWVGWSSILVCRYVQFYGIFIHKIIKKRRVWPLIASHAAVAAEMQEERSSKHADDMLSVSCVWSENDQISAGAQADLSTANLNRLSI